MEENPYKSPENLEAPLGPTRLEAAQWGSKCGAKFGFSLGAIPATIFYMIRFSTLPPENAKLHFFFGIICVGMLVAAICAIIGGAICFAMRIKKSK